MSLNEKPLFSNEEWQACLKVLQVLSRHPHLAEDSPEMKGLVAKLNRKARKSKRRHHLQEKIQHDRNVKENTIRCQKESLEQNFPAKEISNLSSSVAENPILKRQSRCYICKTFYKEVHTFYHLLCPSCANINYKSRFQRIDLTGRIALLTGGRIKIGFETGLKLLRDGAQVCLITRFPYDAVMRYAKEPDFDIWKHRLQIYGLDLRNIRATEAFIELLQQQLPYLDILINNAAQTIRRPEPFYKSLLDAEARLALELSEEQRTVLALSYSATTHLARVPSALCSPSDYFPPELWDRHGQPVDLRPENSWRLGLEEVETAEYLEVQLVNSMAPFLFNSKLKLLMLKSPFERRFIVNVSAMEGQFNRHSKTEFHPHTNMAKAALNMMTRTSAAAYARQGIYMNSVDTGWITDEDPHPKKMHKRTMGFVPPLDEIDGASRIYDPIVKGILEPKDPLFGHFLKDYQSHNW
jgi:NAD(P)-dependent dehydrogenase (short-subunit alcohol dehydrogenase family)